MKGKVCGSLKESVHASATATGMALKAVAAELDWSPSELSMRIALWGDNARAFPCDDEHLVKMLRVTGDHSVLFTLADLLGYECKPKTENFGELLQDVHSQAKALMPKLQLVLDLGAKLAKAGAR